jgi:hypothetical protein
LPRAATERRRSNGKLFGEHWSIESSGQRTLAVRARGSHSSAQTLQRPQILGGALAPAVSGIGFALIFTPFDVPFEWS